MNLFDNIAKQSWILVNTPTHILSYDLNNASLETYNKLDQEIKNNFPWAQKPLKTFWELYTGKFCEEILATLLPIVNYNGQFHVTNIHTWEIQKYWIDDADSVLQPAPLKKSIPLVKLGIARKLV